ncbi:MAG: rRNA pseudouridine synthase, partial [Candidatus Pacebacteria bacterium]|nr:rRNA pseudouridine synthase [Candidatus Paceibacterota bacterium]
MTSNTSTIKLQLFLARAGIASRRKSEALIETGVVTVNGSVAKIGQRVNPHKDKVSIDGKPISAPQKHRYFLINKPVGYISTTSDEVGRKTVLELIPKITERVYPVGRLDQESEGLMLVTNNGELAHTLTHPRYEIAKTYEVLLSSKPTNLALDHLRRGVKLKDGYTKPAEVTVLSHEENQTWIEITITEGRNRQIRRMTERVGYDTIELVRTKMGPFDIGDLDGEKYIELPEEKV